MRGALNGSNEVGGGGGADAMREWRNDGKLGEVGLNYRGGSLKESSQKREKRFKKDAYGEYLYLC